MFYKVLKQNCQLCKRKNKPELHSLLDQFKDYRDLLQYLLQKVSK